MIHSQLKAMRSHPCCARAASCAPIAELGNQRKGRNSQKAEQGRSFGLLMDWETQRMGEEGKQGQKRVKLQKQENCTTESLFLNKVRCELLTSQSRRRNREAARWTHKGLWLNPSHSVRRASCSPVHLWGEKMTQLLWLGASSNMQHLHVFTLQPLLSKVTHQWGLIRGALDQGHHTCVLQLSFQCSEWKAIWFSAVGQGGSSIAPDLSCNLKHQSKIHHVDSYHWSTLIVPFCPTNVPTLMQKIFILDTWSYISNI